MLDAEPDITVVDTTDSGIHAIMLVRSCRPDVVLTGLNLNGLPALEMIRRLALEALDPHPRFVVLAMTASDETVDSILRTDVTGLLMGDSTSEELSSTVRAAAQGKTTLAPQIAQRLIEHFRYRDTVPEDSLPEEQLRSVLAELTPRERQVLLMVGRGLSAEEIANELVIGVATARTHLYRLRCKLDLRDRAQLVSFAYRAGLMQQGICS
jgi:DNA-binding NarL/FixJ family response regulator